MQRCLKPEVLDYVDKFKLFPYFIGDACDLSCNLQISEEDKTKTVDAFKVEMLTVNLPLAAVKLLISVETCLDKCMLVCLHPHINYVALSKQLMSILAPEIAKCYSDETEQAMHSAIQLCQTGKISITSIKRMYSIFSSRRSLGKYKDLVAKMIVTVYMINEGIDPISYLQSELYLGK